MKRIKVALTGADGNVGRLLRREFTKRNIDLRSASGHDPIEASFEGEDVMHGDLRQPAVVDRLLVGVDVLIHMAATSVERPLPEIIENNLVALHQVYEGARRHGVGRVVFASSNHAFGMYGVTKKLKLGDSFRPDGMYGLSKAWGESMARMYWDKHGIEGISVRIGTVMDEPPKTHRQLSTWLGSEDLVQLMLRCIEATDVGYCVVWGISNNPRAYYDLDEGNVIGFMPSQSAEVYASEVLSRPNDLDHVARLFQGGSFVNNEFTPIGNPPAATN